MSIKITRDADQPLYVVSITRIPSEDEASRFLGDLRSVYQRAPPNFVIIYDLGELRVDSGECVVCQNRAFTLAAFYNRADMQELRRRAAEVIIVTRNPLIHGILSMILAVYPSPVKISCRDELPDTRAAQ